MSDKDAMDVLLNAPIVFGLKAQGHLETIEKMLAENKTWNDIGDAIGWMPSAAQDHYCKLKIKEIEVKEEEIEQLVAQGKSWEEIGKLFNWHPNCSHISFETHVGLIKAERFRKLQKSLGEAFIVKEEHKQYRILTAFIDRDGNHIGVVLKLKDAKLTDEGQVLMGVHRRLYAFVKIDEYVEEVQKILKKYDGELIDGVIYFNVNTGFGLPDRLCNYIQAVLEINQLIRYNEKKPNTDKRQT